MNEVKVWEEELILPTYEIGEAEKNPIFSENVFIREVQDELILSCYRKDPGRKRLDKVLKAAILENQYIRVTILPQLGGRILRAYDKTNDYDFVYYNHAIKPVLCGLTGPYLRRIGV